MANFRVLAADKLSKKGLKVLEDASGFEVDNKTGLSEEELCKIIGEYDGLIVRSATKVTPKLLEHATKLKVVGRAGIGVDNINLGACSQRGVVVMNTPTGNAVTTAEHALSLMDALSRKIPQAVASMKAGKWEKSKFKGREKWNKTLGIVGLGNIGRIVADRAQGLRMKVIASDPVVEPDLATELGVELVDFDTLLQRSDFITLHVPAIPATRHLFNDAAFKRMKADALLINASRGGVVDEAALCRAIENKEIAGAAMDVFEKEPIDPAHPLLKLDAVICTPHLGASTLEAQERVAVEIGHQIIAYLSNGSIENGVNVASVAGDSAAKMAPYFGLARRLGALVAQLGAKESVREIRFTATGEVAQLGVKPIAAEGLGGFFEKTLGEPVSAIRAPFDAKDRDIKLAYIEEEADSIRSTTLRVTLTTNEGIHTATGTLGKNGQPWLVGLEGYDIDAAMAKSAIVMRNHDRPGVIGAVGTLLGSKGINVSRMQVGLDDQTNLALALWTVDTDVTDDALDALRKLENVQSVLYVTL